jgi:hypothetical protein
MIISPSGGTIDTNQTGGSPATAQDYADIKKQHTAPTRQFTDEVGITRDTA